MLKPKIKISKHILRAKNTPVPSPAPHMHLHFFVLIR